MNRLGLVALAGAAYLAWRESVNQVNQVKPIGRAERIEYWADKGDGESLYVHEFEEEPTVRDQGGDLVLEDVEVEDGWLVS